ncbi:MAG: hypothetical protein JNM28_02405 [Armatimonadetes bacterium]|nr:hypothetical protein [Armatimonadota bacterium]MBS1711942.1 hypothetical protein [Armatimonadota bacterium]MBX3109504.1 hypothetical protein [Fimbriimonadaceae bacterium]
MNRNSVAKTIFIAIAVVIGAFIGIKLVGGLALGLLGLLVKLAIPAAVVLGILYVVYRFTGGDKSLPGSNRRLP